MDSSRKNIWAKFICSYVAKLELARIFRKESLCFWEIDKKTFARGKKHEMNRYRNPTSLLGPLDCGPHVSVCACAIHNSAVLRGSHGPIGSAPSDRDQVVEVRGCKAGGPVQQHLTPGTSKMNTPGLVLRILQLWDC